MCVSYTAFYPTLSLSLLLNTQTTTYIIVTYCNSFGMKIPKNLYQTRKILTLSSLSHFLSLLFHSCAFSSHFHWHMPVQTIWVEIKWMGREENRRKKETETFCVLYEWDWTFKMQNVTTGNEFKRNEKIHSVRILHAFTNSHTPRPLRLLFESAFLYIIICWEKKTWWQAGEIDSMAGRHRTKMYEAPDSKYAKNKKELSLRFESRMSY